jgi:putative transcriptional regulator
MTAQTTTLSGHAPARLLQAYACGAMGPAASIAMALHLETCSQCAAGAAAFDAVGGALFEQDASLEAEPGISLEDMLAKLDAPQPRRSYAPEVMRFPEPLRAAAQAALNGARWRFAGPGLRTMTLDIPGATAAGELPQLLRIEPGHGAPRHGHGGVELTLVLEGAFRDETGVYGPGDLSVARVGLTHQPIALSGGTCLAYAVSHAPMRFTGMLGFAQRFLTPRGN